MADCVASPADCFEERAHPVAAYLLERARGLWRELFDHSFRGREKTCARVPVEWITQQDPRAQHVQFQRAMPPGHRRERIVRQSGNQSTYIPLGVTH